MPNGAGRATVVDVERTARFLRYALAAILVASAFVHLGRPEVFEPIVPPSLPWPRAIVLVTGVVELLLGVGLAFERTRRPAAWSAVAFFVLVVPANVHMAVNGVQLDGVHLPEWAAWARLPLQLVLVFWASLFCRRRVVARPDEALLA